MKAAAHIRDGRTGAVMERVAGLIRLLAWAAMVGGYGLMLWALSGSAHAGDPAVAPARTGTLAETSLHGTAARHREHGEARP